MRGLLSLVLFCILSLPIFAQDDHAHHADASKLGSVHFPISCAASAQAELDRAMALLHSFWYNEAEKTFAAIAAAEPACGIAWWGVAMSNYHPLWAPPTPDELRRGSEAAEKAARTGAKTQRERDYIAAAGAFYHEAAKRDHLTRVIAYRKAMEQLHQRYPEDTEGSILYALSLIKQSPASSEDLVNQKEAARILNSILPKQPNHPGVAHYLIHSNDLPETAQFALPAARSYAKVAPDSPHALHMPSHIFTRLGLWQDSIQSNIASAHSARNHVAKTMPGAASYDELHAMDYLVYAYLQLGQDDKAKQVLDQARSIQKVDLATVQAAYALAAMPARYALERHDWKAAAALPFEPTWFPWKEHPSGEAITHFARGLGAARSGDAAMARREAARLAELQRILTGIPDTYNWPAYVEAQRLTVAAWASQAEGRQEEALTLMRQAADLEDKTGKHPVTPGAVLPARELLGELLLEQNRLADALREFEASLKNSPGRRRGIEGAARARKASEPRP